MGAAAEQFSGKLCSCLSGHEMHIQGAQMGHCVSTHAQVYPPLLAQALADCCGAYLGLVEVGPARHDIGIDAAVV